jgi:Zn-dependent protease with chaperone function
VLKIYYLVTFAIGTLLTVPLAQALQLHEIGARGAAIMTLCWNVLFIMILPLVMDWGERRYFKARFLQLEEVAQTNPELAAVISEHCKRLSIPGLRFAVVHTQTNELFSYGLWRHNPRVVVSDALLSAEPNPAAIPSVEAELSRFANQDHTFVFLLFTILQVILVLGLAFCLLPH